MEISPHTVFDIKYCLSSRGGEVTGVCTVRLRFLGGRGVRHRYHSRHRRSTTWCGGPMERLHNIIYLCYLFSPISCWSDETLTCMAQAATTVATTRHHPDKQGAVAIHVPVRRGELTSRSRGAEPLRPSSTTLMLRYSKLTTRPQHHHRKTTV